MAFPDGYAAYKPFSVRNTYIDEDLTNFRLLVRIVGDADIGARARADGYDLRFTSGDGSTLIDHERVSFSISGGQSSAVYWLKPSTLYTAASTPFRLYYGNPAASDGQNAAAVWAQSYGVWHLENNLLDSSGQADGTDHGTVDAAGKIGRGRDCPFNWDLYEGAWIETAIVGSRTAFSAAAWVKLSSTDGQRNIMAQDMVGSRGWVMRFSNGRLQIEAGGASPAESYGSTYVSAGTWYRMWCVSDGSQIRAYLNGVQEVDWTKAITATNDTLAIGRRNYSGWPEYAEAVIDEVSFESPRSAAWVKFDYYNQSSVDAEITWGEESTVSGGHDRIVVASIGVQDQPLRSAESVRTSHSTLAASDRNMWRGSRLRRFVDTIGFVDALIRHTPGVFRTLSVADSLAFCTPALRRIRGFDYLLEPTELSLQDSCLRNAEIRRQLTDWLELLAERKNWQDWHILVAVTLGVADEVIRSTESRLSIAEQLALVEQVLRASENCRELFDAIGFRETASGGKILQRLLQDLIGTIDATSRSVTSGRRIQDPVGLVDEAVRQAEACRLASASLAILTAVKRVAHVLRAFEDGLSLEDRSRQKAARRAKAVDQMGLLDEAARKTASRRRPSDHIGMAEGAKRRVESGRMVEESLVLDGLVEAASESLRRLVDRVGLAEHWRKTRELRRTVEDSLELETIANRKARTKRRVIEPLPVEDMPSTAAVVHRQKVDAIGVEADVECAAETVRQFEDAITLGERVGEAVKSLRVLADRLELADDRRQYREIWRIVEDVLGVEARADRKVRLHRRVIELLSVGDWTQMTREIGRQARDTIGASDRVERTAATARSIEETIAMADEVERIVEAVRSITSALGLEDPLEWLGANDAHWDDLVRRTKETVDAELRRVLELEAELERTEVAEDAVIRREDEE